MKKYRSVFFAVFGAVLFAWGLFPILPGETPAARFPDQNWSAPLVLLQGQAQVDEARMEAVYERLQAASSEEEDGSVLRMGLFSWAGSVYALELDHGVLYRTDPDVPLAKWESVTLSEGGIRTLTLEGDTLCYGLGEVHTRPSLINMLVDGSHSYFLKMTDFRQLELATMEEGGMTARDYWALYERDE